VDTTAFLGKLWRGDRGVKMQRQKNHREKQEDPDEASANGIGSRGREGLHGPLDNPVLRPCQTFVPQTRQIAPAQRRKRHW
jgi:hypothetical protein